MFFIIKEFSKGEKEKRKTHMKNHTDPSKTNESITIFDLSIHYKNKTTKRRSYIQSKKIKYNR